jgi:hypothetical protein
MTTASRPSNLSSHWFKDCKTQKEKDDFKEYLRNSKGIIDKLLAILQAELDSLEQTTLIDFDSPSWSHKQAYKEGEKKAFTFVKNLF